MKKKTFFTIFIALPLLALLILAGVVPVILASPSKEEWTHHRMSYIADDLYIYRAEHGNWPSSLRNAWLSSRRPTKPHWKEYAFDEWGKPIAYHVENASTAFLRDDVPATRATPAHGIERRLSVDDTDFSLWLPVTNVTLREVALSIGKPKDGNRHRDVHFQTAPCFRVYIADDVPDEKLPLTAFWDVGCPIDHVLSRLAVAFRVPYWKTDHAAIFSPRLFRGSVNIRSNETDESGWLDAPLPSKLSERPSLEDFVNYSLPNSGGVHVVVDEACRNMIVPLADIQMTWRHGFETITKVLPVDIVVSEGLVSILPRTVDDIIDADSFFVDLIERPEF